MRRIDLVAVLLAIGLAIVCGLFGETETAVFISCMVLGWFIGRLS